MNIVIDPVTRIEGHSKITIHLDEHGTVQSAPGAANSLNVIDEHGGTPANCVIWP